jgi:predicted glycoside hydrolase/deacetylase ChbG (UPF0249 family)
MSRALIVNADDFGISEGVSRGIVEAHTRGIVSATSLMANLPAAAHAARLAAETPTLDLGLHFNLTAGRPLCDPSTVSTLVGSDGKLLPLGTLLSRLSLGRVRREHVREELTAQLDWAHFHGLRLSHLDSHHHVHAHPWIASTVLEVVDAARIPFVRRPFEVGWPSDLGASNARDVVRGLAIGVASWLMPRHTQRVSFRGIGLGTGFAAPSLRHVLARLPAGVTELMVHPGYVDAELGRITSFTTGRDSELAALTEPATRDVLRDHGVELTSFRDLVQTRSYT